MKVWEQLLGRQDPSDGESRFSFQDWVNLFTFDGNNYPLLNTSMGRLDEEQIVSTTDAALKANGPVFALVVARMQVFSQIRFQWTRFEKGRPTELFGSADLAILERPWPNGVTADLLARMEMDVSRAGNCYVRRMANRLSVLLPQYVHVLLGSQEDADHPAEAADCEVIGYTYSPPHAQPTLLLPNEVAHYAPIPDPSSRFLGMSWITPVIRDVSGDDAAVQHKSMFFKNAATPNLAIKFDPSIGIEQVKEFKALLEAEHRGAWNAYKTMYLGGGADPVTVGQNFQQLEFAATQGKGESRLASAAGVPPSWVGFSEGLQGSALNAGNFGAARRRFGDGTMQHLWANAASSLSPVVRRADKRTERATLWFDTRGVPFLREDSKDASEIQNKEATTIAALVRDGFTPESVVAAVINQDWSLLKHTGLVSVQMQPADGSGNPAAGSGNPATAPAAEKENPNG